MGGGMGGRETMMVEITMNADGVVVDEEEQTMESDQLMSSEE